ncbi:VOC family protein [Lutibacter citreus]|uniref:VOC family protein n=1 Tax=Lutibacter citreus TaxID=2138210 RepID=UPI000DBDFF5A|nr:VOC family protein [Lutibacter citreus]
MNINYKFHHIGIATKSINKCITFYEKLGYSPSDIKIEPSQNVRICFLKKEDNPIIEIIEELNEDSAISLILKKMGSTVYHTCYEVTDIVAAADELEDSGFRLLFEPKISNTMDNGLFCYLYSVNCGFIELYQKQI